MTENLGGGLVLHRREAWLEAGLSHQERLSRGPLEGKGLRTEIKMLESQSSGRP